MLIMLAYVFVPVDSVFSCFGSKNIEVWENMFSKDKFEDLALTFVDDFDRVNPVTETEGQIE